MSKLQPDYYISRITQLTPSFLRSRGVRGLILDVDNTLTTHDDPTPWPDIAAWLEKMRREGMAMLIVSNNSNERVKPFAAVLGLDYVADGKKPSTDGMARAAGQMGLSPREIAVVGDQIFTDVLGANLFGVPCIFVFPMEMEKTRFFRFKRRMEIPFLPKKIYEENKELN